MAHIARLLQRNACRWKQTVPRLFSPNAPSILARHGGGSGHGASDSVPRPSVKPPGPEWIDKGWKDDGMGWTNYPNYVEWSYQNRDPNMKYWDQQDRRDYGEPLHINDDGLNVWMYDDMTNYKYGPYEVLFHLTVALSLLGLVYWYSEYVYDAPSRQPALPKTYPYNNLYIEMGGDPNKEPTEQDLKRRIPTPHWGWY